MNDVEELTQDCKQKLSEGFGIEEIIGYLRSLGCSKSRSITILHKLNYFPGEKARYIKFVVHFSKTWSDLREVDEQWHENILKTLENDEFLK